MTSYASFKDGVQNSVLVELSLEDIIFVNRTNTDHKIAVFYNEIEIIDSQEIEKIKTEIHSIHTYDISVYIDYNDVGYIKRIVFYPNSN